MGKQSFLVFKHNKYLTTAIKEVERYFARKLLVRTAVPFSEKLLVPREKARYFLEWLENR